jgi:hypothetical protein
MSTQPYPSQQFTRPLPVLIATFVAMFTMGMIIFQNPKTPPPIPTPTPHTENMVKIFLVLVDDLNTPKPQIDSLWTISINTKLSNINFLEMTDNEDWDDLLSSFSLDQNLQLSDSFIQLAKSTVTDADGYILLDRYGAATILSSWIPDKISLSSSSKISSEEITAFCGALDGSGQPKPIHLGQLTADKHMVIDPNTTASLQVWEVLIYPQEQRSCLALPNNSK